MKGQLQTRHQEGLPDAWVFMDLIIWMSVSCHRGRKQNCRPAALGTNDHQETNSVLPNAWDLQTLFFPQWNKPQTFLSFCKNKICTEGSNLNEKPIGFGWLWCFPKVQEKHIWSLGSFSFCFREGIFLWDHFKLETQIQISHLWSHCHTIDIEGQSPSTPQRGYNQNLSSQTRVSQHETQKT